MHRDNEHFDSALIPVVERPSASLRNRSRNPGPSIRSGTGIAGTGIAGTGIEPQVERSRNLPLIKDQNSNNPGY